MKPDTRALVSFDWSWFFAVLCLVGAGLLAVWSTTTGTSQESYFNRQLVYFGLGLLVFLIVLYFDYHTYSDYITFLYLAGIALLVLVLLFGKTVHNSKSWLPLGGSLAFQPSELVKIVAIIALAKYYADIERDYLEVSELLIGGFLVLVPMVLVMLQGDLGTAVTFLPIFAVLSFLAGLRRKYVYVALVAILISSPALWMQLKDYQKERIQTVFNPSNDPHNYGYHTIQSKIAIGSGKFLGKGFKQGSQSQLGFLPARHTDFVFAVLAEERGFIGSILVLGLFLFVLTRLLRTAREAKDRLGTMITIGVLALFVFHVVINIGMVVGLLPIAGIPLPFMSAGGSALISSFAALALCMNVRMRRYVN